MAQFSMDGVVFDRLQMAIAEDSNGTVLYTLNQLSDASIDITAESKDATDANGTLIKRFYTGKSGSFSATNAIVDFNVLAASTGTAKQIATESAKIQMPCVKIISSGTKDITISGLLTDGIAVEGLAGNGTRIKTYTKDTAASATAFSVSGEKITLPTDTGVAQFVIKCERMVSNGVKVLNSANKFPKNVKLTIKALAVDVCNPDELVAAYIVFPSFQVSPETAIALSTDGKLDFKGDLQVSYCDKEKLLYGIYMAEDDKEEE